MRDDWVIICIYFSKYQDKWEIPKHVGLQRSCLGNWYKFMKRRWEKYVKVKWNLLHIGAPAPVEKRRSLKSENKEGVLVPATVFMEKVRFSDINFET